MVFFQQKYRNTLGNSFYILSILLSKPNFTISPNILIFYYENIVDLYKTILCPQDAREFPVLDIHQYAHMVGLNSGIYILLICELI